MTIVQQTKPVIAKHTASHEQGHLMLHSACSHDG